MKFTEFVRRYPNYSRLRFGADKNGNVEFLFNDGNYNPFDKDGKLVKVLYQFPSWNGHTYKPENIKEFLYTNDKKAFEKATEEVNEIEFPKEYRFNKDAHYKFLSWDSNPAHLNYYSFNIYITPKEKTNFKFRNIFDDSELIIKKNSDVKKWLKGPDLSFWAQALNFAFWCATGGCGVTREMFSSESPQVDSFYKFHVYFTTRRILNELQCPLPKDRNFSKFDNFYNKGAFENLKTEFSTPNDFRYRGSSELSHLKNVFNERRFDPWTYKPIVSPVTDPDMKNQYEYFFPPKSVGLTKAGLARINQSIEAFVYCILGSQVQTRSSIIGDGGIAQETQKVFLQLFESSVVERDISKSIQRYQFALQQAKQKLDFAVAVGCWLLPSSMIINAHSVVGYNNRLQKATANMRFGLNETVNNDTKPSGIANHNMGDSKVILPHQPDKGVKVKPKPETKPADNSKPTTTDRHGNNLAAVTVVAAGLAWYLFR